MLPKQIARLAANGDGNAPFPEALKLLLIRRARIPKKAHAKVNLAADVVASNYTEDSRWLVYCEDQNQLSEVTEAIRRRGFRCAEYHSAMAADRGSTLERFTNLGGIIVAIKCLDEGVDIPSVTHALILASSKNPREFIQRRGRILRQSPGKHYAEIHDAVVVPPASEEDEQPELNILRTELARALRFSQGAANRSSLYSLYQLADRANLKDVEDLSRHP
jgi:superfamily II DNA or RNA helicase